MSENESNTIDRVLNTIDSLMLKVGEVVDKYSQPTFEAVLDVIQLHGVYSLISNTVITTVLLTLFYFLLQRTMKAAGDETRDFDEKGFYVFSSIALIIISILVFIIGLLNLLSFDMWLKIIDPKYYLLHEVVQSILKGK